MPKTVRFTRVVERSGQPEAHALWLPPDKDPEFKRALAAHRVMSVQPRRGKTDLGFVGFDEKRSKGGQFLIFPKSLRSFEGAEVVGIKFDLIEQPKIVRVTGDPHAVPTAARKAASAAAKARAARELAAASKTEAKAESESEPATEEKTRPTPRETSAAPARVSAPRLARVAPPRHTRRAAAPHALDTSSSRAASPDTAVLVREIRAALKELQRGKTVAAYQRLEHAIAP